MTATRFRTLGRIELTGGDGRVLHTVLAQPKRLLLLAHLVVGRPVGPRRRDALVALFWPEASEQRARASLSQALSFLRRALGEATFVTRGADEVGVAVSLLWCDAVEFERLLEAGADAEALALYEGDFLDALHVSDAPELEQWLERERRRLRCRAADVAARLSEAATARGDHGEALRLAERALALAGDDERALRRLMAASERAGDRAGALRAFEEVAARLRSEFNLEPAAETIALARRLGERGDARSGAEAASPSAAAAPPASAGPEVAADVPGDAGRPAGRRFWRRRALVIAAAAMGVLGMAASDALVGGWPKAAPLAAARVLVVPFDDRSGDPALAAFGAMTADWLTEGLVRTALVDVVDARVALLSTRQVDSAAPVLQGPARLRAITERSGAGLVVWGAYYRSGDSLYVQASLTDATSGKLLRAVPPVGGPVAAPAALLAELRTRTMGAVAAVLDPRLASLTAAGSAPPAYEAYADYIRALELFSSQRYGQALPLLARAHERDTSFVLPLFWAAFAHGNSGRPAQRESVVAMIASRRDRLSAVDRSGLDYFLAQGRNDDAAALEALRRASALVPQSNWTYMLGQRLQSMSHHREAVQVLTSLDPYHGWVRNWPSYWKTLTGAYHALGEHESALETSRQAAQVFPDEAFLRGFAMMELAALGRVREVDSLVDWSVAAVRDTSRPTPPPSNFMSTAAGEFRTHGHSAAARRMASRCVAWSRAHLVRYSTSYKDYEGLLWNWADCAYLAGDFVEARRLYDQLRIATASESPPWLRLHRREAYARLGIIAARAKDRPLALQYSDSLAAMATARDPDFGASGQARIAAALGERARAAAILKRLTAKDPPFWYVSHDPDFDLLLVYPPMADLVRPTDDAIWHALRRQVRRLAER